ncbi:hypothetical protein [Nitrincola alkalisediminis]|uniref:hypothetical protein n=1 Tax=Nitrincola alkalisediminis TaxID=1366656 RepID=UPI001874EB54|nr:hypothetical protein [Nitrincola alkalisediminis]
MLILLVILAGLMVLFLTHQAFEWPAILNSSPELTNQGWILLIVALLQVISYVMLFKKTDQRLSHRECKNHRDAYD